MAQDTLPEQRTEMPTERRINDLRKEGTVPLSQDAVMIISMAVAFILIQFGWEYLYEDMKLVMVKSFKMIANPEPLTISDLRFGFMALIWIIIPKLFILFGVIALIAIIAVMLQTRWNVKEKKIHFQFSKLNPMAGVKRLFSLQNWTNVIKATAKLCLIIPIGYWALKKFAPQMTTLMHTSIENLMAYTGDAMVYLFWQIFQVLVVLAVIDYFWTKHNWLKNAKMTKDEIKDERKSLEGDEETKRKIQAKGLGRIAQRIRNSVPQADVVITNPTHYAIALKYDRSSMDAPVILAKGKGFLALKIREIAKEHRVPIVERKPLARALYASGEVGKSIPYELFRAVAEVIAYVYKLKNPWAAANGERTSAQ
jgi:flagellar biosynthetic protein FlhB